MITVYTLPNCVQCTATHRVLAARGIEHITIDLSEDETARRHAKELGYQRAPIVLTATTHWSGFRPDLINALEPDPVHA